MIDLEKAFEKYTIEYCKSFYGSPYFQNALKKTSGIAWYTKYMQTGNAFTADKYVVSLLIKIHFEVTTDIPYRQYAGFYY